MDPIDVYMSIIVVGIPTALFLAENNLILATSAVIGWVVFSIIMAIITVIDRRRRENEYIRRIDRLSGKKKG